MSKGGRFGDSRDEPLSRVVVKQNALRLHSVAAAPMAIISVWTWTLMWHRQSRPIAGFCVGG